MILKLTKRTGDVDTGNPPPAAGIFEERDAAPGQQLELKVRDSHGARMALRQFRAGTLNDELVEDLRADGMITR